MDSGVGDFLNMDPEQRQQAEENMRNELAKVRRRRFLSSTFNDCSVNDVRWIPFWKLFTNIVVTVVRKLWAHTVPKLSLIILFICLHPLSSTAHFRTARASRSRVLPSRRRRKSTPWDRCWPAKWSMPPNWRESSASPSGRSSSRISAADWKTSRKPQRTYWEVLTSLYR